MSLKLSLPWKWFGGLALLLTVLLLVVNICIDLSLPPYLTARIRVDLEREARLVREAFTHATPGQVNALAHDLSQKTGLRVTIIATNGVVIGESDKSPEQIAQIENHLYRPEVQEALHHGVGSATRHSETVDVDLLYVAIPLRQPDLTALIRVALPLREVAATTNRVRRTVAAASLAVGLAAVPLLVWMARRTTAPILEMSEVAGCVAHGDFSRQASARAGGELGELATALNDMAAQLEARLRELRQEKTDLSAILAHMTEGVLVVDSTGKIRLANNALRRQFELGDETLGRTLLEVFRNVSLQELVADAGRRADSAARELTVLSPAERVFSVNAASLRGDSGGVVVVFHDISRLKQLENVRKEFVANVSHELRTPLSIIKGYVETLLEEQPPDGVTSRQFLETVAKHARRLEILIGDLLSISELESQQAQLHLGPAAIRSLAGAVADELQKRAADRQISVAVEIPESLPPVRADAQRVHQVLVNLLDNAIKYSQPGGSVRISASLRGGEVEVSVADNGPGIAPEHVARIFERFYRVDKARSRELGGTGLGLSIVKHIVQAHGGRVWVESQLEKGSTFYFTLPRA